jgi:hypothetical protein
VADTCQHGSEPLAGTYEMRRAPWLVEKLLVSEEEMCIMKLGVMPLTLRCLDTQSADTPVFVTLSIGPSSRNAHEGQRTGSK